MSDNIKVGTVLRALGHNGKTYDYIVVTRIGRYAGIFIGGSSPIAPVIIDGFTNDVTVLHE